jgi:hypothetical protein
VLGFFVLGKTEDEGNARILAQLENDWLSQSLFRIPGQVDLSSYLE